MNISHLTFVCTTPPFFVAEKFCDKEYRLEITCCYVINSTSDHFVTIYSSPLPLQPAFSSYPHYRRNEINVLLRLRNCDWWEIGWRSDIDEDERDDKVTEGDHEIVESWLMKTWKEILIYCVHIFLRLLYYLW